MEQKKFYSHKPYSHNLPYRFFGTVSVHACSPRYFSEFFNVSLLTNVRVHLWENINNWTLLLFLQLCCHLLFYTSILYLCKFCQQMAANSNKKNIMIILVTCQYFQKVMFFNLYNTNRRNVSNETTNMKRQIFILILLFQK